MTGRFVQAAKAAYEYPLLLNQLWHTPLMRAPDQLIVYRDIKRVTYRRLRERIGRLASGLATQLKFESEYEICFAALPDHDFPDFDENTLATIFYRTGTTGSPKGVCFSHRQLVLHSLAEMAFVALPRNKAGFVATMYTCRSPRCFTCMPGDFRGRRRLQVYPLRRWSASQVYQNRGRTILEMLLAAATEAKTDLAGLKMVDGVIVPPTWCEHHA